MAVAQPSLEYIFSPPVGLNKTLKEGKQRETRSDPVAFRLFLKRSRTVQENGRLPVPYGFYGKSQVQRQVLLCHPDR
jgi:hypothetical protein